MTRDEYVAALREGFAIAHDKAWLDTDDETWRQWIEWRDAYDALEARIAAIPDAPDPRELIRQARDTIRAIEQDGDDFFRFFSVRALLADLDRYLK